jgi:dGTPase
MDWEQLLSEKRVRELLGGPESRRDPDDRRTEFDRDFDRAIFSTPVKRLQDKAQVFPLEPNDSVRTRLTHSLEVSCVARGMASSAGQWMAKTRKLGEAPERSLRAIEAIAATCGLIHDLGNPPFGHAGELAIQDWFAGKVKEDEDFLAFPCHPKAEQLRNDFLRFEGNAQTLRLVSKLQILADEFGLNLTCGTLSAACKYLSASHEAESESTDQGRKKPGYFASEEDVVKVVREQTGTGDARNPITLLVEAADDVVYATVDLEDGVKKGVLHWKTIERRLRKEAKKDSSGTILACLESVGKQVSKECIRRMLLSGRAEDEALVQAFRVAAIARSVAAVVKTFRLNYEHIMQGQYASELIKDGTAGVLVRACKDLGKEFVYRADETLRLELRGRRVIHDLMDIFWEGAQTGKLGGFSFSDKEYALLSKNYRTICEHALREERLPEGYCKLQLVTDYICGMTDTFACRLHQSLTNG